MTSRELILSDGRILYRFVAAFIFGLIAIGLLAFSRSDQTTLYIGLAMLAVGFFIFISGSVILRRNRYLLSYGSRVKANPRK